MSSTLKFNPVVGGVEVQVDGIKVAQFKPTGSGMEIPAATAAGHAVRYDQSFGLGQTWQSAELTNTGALFTDGTAKYRAQAVTYTSPANKAIFIHINGVGSSSGNALRVVVAGVTMRDEFDAVEGSIQLVIPPNTSYAVYAPNNINEWSELR